MYGTLHIFAMITVHSGNAGKVNTEHKYMGKRVTLYRRYSITENEAVQLAQEFKQCNDHISGCIRYIWIPEHVDLEHAMSAAEYAIAAE